MGACYYDPPTQKGDVSKIHEKRTYNQFNAPMNQLARKL